MAKKEYTREELVKKVEESDVISVYVVEDEITVFLTSGRRIVYDSDGRDYIEEGGVRWVGDDVDYYSWVRDLVRF